MSDLKECREMIPKIVAFLLFLFIFGIIGLARADSNRSANYAVHREKPVKMDKNGGAVQKKESSAGAPIKTSKKYGPGFHSPGKYKDAWWTIGDGKLNFLKMEKEKIRYPFGDRWHSVIFPYTFFQNTRVDQFFSLQDITRKKIPSESPPPISRLLSVENKYYGGEGWMAYKLLESNLEPKRWELLKEIFVGLNFSFDMKNRHLFFEMNAAPDVEKKSGVTIPF
jgi:hypothetical protein